MGIVDDKQQIARRRFVFRLNDARAAHHNAAGFPIWVMSAGWLKAPNGTALGWGADNLADDGARVATDELFSGQAGQDGLADAIGSKYNGTHPETMSGGCQLDMAERGDLIPDYDNLTEGKHTAAPRRPLVEGCSIESVLPDFSCVRAGWLCGWCNGPNGVGSTFERLCVRIAVNPMRGRFVSFARLDRCTRSCSNWPPNLVRRLLSAAGPWSGAVAAFQRWVRWRPRRGHAAVG